MPETGQATRSRAQRDAMTGTRIRERRMMLGLRQSDLARRVEISPSYLNLIEHNRRRIGGKLLVDLAGALSVDISALTHGAEAEQLDQLSEAAVAGAAAAPELERVEEFLGRFPGWARLVGLQQRQISHLQRQIDSMADRLSHDPALSGALHDVLSKVTAIQSTATILAETGDLDPEWQEKFIANLSVDSTELAARSAALMGYLDGSAETELSLATPHEELEAYLADTGFHLPLLEAGGAPQAQLSAVKEALSSPAARDLALEYFTRYQSDARQMPLAELQEVLAQTGPDPAKIAAQFGTDLAAAMRRLASLPPEPGQPGLGLVICDGSGALILRKSTDGFVIPRFGTGCAFWPLYRALSQPGRALRDRVSQSGDGDRASLAYAISMPVPPMVFDGRQPMEATMLLVPEAALPSPAPEQDRFLAIGATCRSCQIEPCSARRDASVLRESF